jgi:TolA-binding protein
MVEDENRQQKRASSRPVPRKQYDELLVKYEELAKKYEQLKEGKGAAQSALLDDLGSSENFAPSSAVDTETVNLFPQGQPVVATTSQASTSELEAQLAQYRRALSLKATNPGEATKIFQQLENTAAPAIRARARFQLGELMFARQQFDLALQVFEEIIGKEAHSAVVLDALKYAVVCSEKLGLRNKRDQYASMLQDVFEVN